MQRSGSILLAGLVTWAAAAPAGPSGFGPQVDSMRCGRELVTVGDEAFQLLEKCGDPEYRQVVQLNRLRDAARSSNGGFEWIIDDSAYRVTEEWVYKQGPGRLIKILTVTGGILTDIRLSERQ